MRTYIIKDWLTEANKSQSNGNYELLYIFEKYKSHSRCHNQNWSEPFLEQMIVQIVHYILTGYWDAILMMNDA